MNLKLVNSIREGKTAMKNENGIIEQIMKNIVERLRFSWGINNIKVVNNAFIQIINSKSIN